MSHSELFIIRFRISSVRPYTLQSLLGIFICFAKIVVLLLMLCFYLCMSQ